jgi:hypothetical protein
MHWANPDFYSRLQMPWGVMPMVATFGVLTVGILFFVLVVWTIAWKGMALWKAAREGHKGWFIALLIINTAGILEILYIYIFSKKSSSVNKE